MSRAICSTGVSSAMLMTFLLMIARTSRPFFATISASETTPTILPFLPDTGAPLIWLLISSSANFFTDMLGVTVMMSRVMMSLAFIAHLPLQFSFEHQRGQIADAATVAPFVVVPGENLGHLSFDRNRRQAVDDRRGAIAAKIAGNQRLIAVFQNAPQLSLSGLFQRAVDVFIRR